jgi:hypothetical protein
MASWLCGPRAMLAETPAPMSHLHLINARYRDQWIAPA